MLSELLAITQPVGIMLCLTALLSVFLGTENLYVLELAGSGVFLLGLGLAFK